MGRQREADELADESDVRVEEVAQEVVPVLETVAQGKPDGLDVVKQKVDVPVGEGVFEQNTLSTGYYV